MRDSRGFTLIEVSTVMVIVALLVGGILFGRDLIRASELRAVTSEVQKIKSAVLIFKSQYNGLPADIPNARSIWSQCIDDGINTCNGNHNGRLGMWEDLRAWQQLSLAGLMPGSYTGTASAPIRNPSINIMPSLIGGGYILLDNSGDFSVTDFPHNRSNVLLTGDNDCGAYLGCGNMDSWMAQSIDRKVDDGLARSGEVKGAQDWDYLQCLTAGEYDLNIKDRGCKLGFFY